ncbi:hypothetical protein [Micromonospora sp. NPDC005806]
MGSTSTFAASRAGVRTYRRRLLRRRLATRTVPDVLTVLVVGTTLR